MAAWLRKKFSRKLGLAFCLVVGISLTAAGFLAVGALKKRLLEELEKNLSFQAEQLALVVARESFLHPGPALRETIQGIDRASGARVTFIRRDGRVTADSEVDARRIDDVESHAGRPEVIEALRSGMGSDVRHSHTLGVNFLYVAVPFAPSGEPLGTLRLALPLTTIEAEVSSFSRLVFLSVGAAVVIGLLLVLAAARWLTSPLEEITRTARAVASGRMEDRALIETEDEIGELARAFNGMTEKLALSLAQIESEKNEMAAILASMVEHVIAVDRAGRILFLNPAARKLLSGGEDSAGRPFGEVVRQAALRDILDSVLAGGEERSEEVRLLLPEERIFELRARALERPAGGGALLVLHDVTRIHALEQVRREFVANVSHELRTPLTAIQGFAETLLDGALADPGHNREFVHSIHDEALRLTHLVDDLLDLAAIESGRRKPRFEPLAPAVLIKEAAEALAPLARKRGVALEAMLPADTPSVLADREQLKQVLLNLLDNAIKFNREGGRVEVTAVSRGGMVSLSIKDTGSGIPEKDLPRIFERFYRVDKARSRELGGTGLGLSIVKHIIDSHRGRVGVESRPGEGSTFTVALPKA